MQKYKNLFATNPAIEDIFSTKNLDEDCHQIAWLMTPIENAIDQYLFDGQDSEAVDLFLQLVDSMCYHFVADEHWTWFDDMYDPGYSAGYIWERIREELVRFPEDVVQRLRKELMELSGTEACQNFCIPPIDRWLEDLENNLTKGYSVIPASKTYSQKTATMISPDPGARIRDLW